MRSPQKWCILAAALLTVTAIAAAARPGITIQTLTPQPAEPGDTVKLSLLAENRDDSRGTFQPVTLTTVDGITEIGSTATLTEQFTLCGNCQTIGTFYLEIDPDTPSGTYPVTVTMATQDGDSVKKTAEINVDGIANPVVDISRNTLVPGETETLDITIENVGTEQTTETLLEPTTDRFSFLPATLRFGAIQPQDSATQTVTITSDEELEAGIQKLGFTLSYSEDGERQTKTVELPVHIEQQATLAIEDYTIGDATIGRSTAVTVQIENLGPGKAERIVSNMTCQNADMQTSSAFIGQLGDDESVPMVFDLIPRGTAVDCTLQTTYQDTESEQITQNLTFRAAAVSNTWLYTLPIILVAAGALWYWRRQRENELEEV